MKSTKKTFKSVAIGLLTTLMLATMAFSVSSCIVPAHAYYDDYYYGGTYYRTAPHHHHHHSHAPRHSHHHHRGY